jgi:hypothetical protein
MQARCNVGQARWIHDDGERAARDATPMEARENLPATRAGVASIPMLYPTRKHLRAPAGCEAHLTRRQAAALLGFKSEFKVRELERQGLLRAVRGPMRTAFYPRPEVLALKARLALPEAGPDASESWSDADLIALLGHPKPSGQLRAALDLVLETHISIERAERVYGFWANGTAPPASARVCNAAAPRPTSPTAPERRGQDRLVRDNLIRELRDPDPRTRQQAFARLREL